MRVGEDDDLDAEICPPDAVNQLIRWTSTNTAVVWVNEATGRVEARGVGSATVYATAQRIVSTVERMASNVVITGFE